LDKFLILTCTSICLTKITCRIAPRNKINQIADNGYAIRTIPAGFQAANGFRNEGWENYRQQLLCIVAGRGTEANYQAASRQA